MDPFALLFWFAGCLILAFWRVVWKGLALAVAGLVWWKIEEEYEDGKN